ncbi:motility associated factor glycosyltransferase family protein [Oceanidesulfovibrio marinus]|nr:6-hydroxymethylpterin diphosphokinase MptE-like protein [Oceanidesulfovibrio marinus]
MERLPHLTRNLEALAGRMTATLEWIKSQMVQPEAVAERIVNHAGRLDWRMENGATLFAAAAPPVFYKDWGAMEERDAKGLTVLVGVNLGYGLNEILKSAPPAHTVLVVEPRAEVLVACLGQTDYSPFIEAGRLIILPPDENAIYEALRRVDVHFVFGRIIFRGDMPSRQMGPEYDRLGRIIRNTLENMSVEFATLRKKQDTMVGNELSNFKRAFEDGSVARLQGAAAGVSAVILGAGPSLEMFAANMAQSPGHACYATALQTLPALQKYGLVPHFCMAIDYSRGMRKVFKRLDPEFAKGIPLLYSTKLDPEVLENYPGPAIPFWTRGGLGTYALADREPVFNAGTNVSVTLYRLLAWMGVGRILLAGMDFAWKGDHSHAGGHHNNVKGSVTLENADGETLHSTLSYTTALRDLIGDIRRLGLPTGCLYGGGAVIQGAQQLDFSKAVMEGFFASEPGSLEHFTNAVGAAHAPQQAPVFPSRSQQWNTRLRQMVKEFEKLAKKPERNAAQSFEGLKRLNAFLRSDPVFLPYLYNEFMDVAGLTLETRPFGPQELSKVRQIAKRVREKVRRMEEDMGFVAAEERNAPPSRRAGKRRAA